MNWDGFRKEILPWIGLDSSFSWLLHFGFMDDTWFSSNHYLLLFQLMCDLNVRLWLFLVVEKWVQVNFASRITTYSSSDRLFTLLNIFLNFFPISKLNQSQTFCILLIFDGFRSVAKSIDWISEISFTKMGWKTKRGQELGSQHWIKCTWWWLCWLFTMRPKRFSIFFFYMNVGVCVVCANVVNWR